MNPINISDVRGYVEQNIGNFHQKRLQSLETLSLERIIQRKNPYLFKAKQVETAEQIVRGFVDAHISSQEETLFGDWLEGLAIFINSRVFNGRKSGVTGMDLEFDLAGIRYIVTIKSSPHWGNSSQINKMKADFNTAKKTLRTSNSQLQIVAVNGCCYGKDKKPDKGDYFKYCGQQFWEFISGEADLFVEIIEPLGFQAKEKNEEFHRSYAMLINRFTLQFAQAFCTPSGEIDWQKIVRMNSAK